MTPAARRFVRHNADHALAFYRWIPGQGLYAYTFTDGSTMQLSQADHDTLKHHNTPIHWGRMEHAA